MFNDELDFKNAHIWIKAIFDDSPISLIITDHKGNIEYANKYFSQVTGYSIEELLGQNPRLLKSGKHSQDYYKNMWNEILSGNSWTDVFFNKKKNGDLYWEKQYIYPLTDKYKQTIKFIAIKIDITQQIKYEEQLIQNQNYLKTILTSIPVLLFVVDKNGTFHEIMAHDELLLYTNSNLIINRNIFEIFPPALANLFNEFILKTIENKKSQVIEYKLETFAGEKWFEARSAYFNNNNQALIAAYDITERKNYETRLNDLIITKDKFFSIIAHDLKNPMHAMLALSEMLSTNSYSQERVTELSKMMYQSSREAYELLENLLEWSRSQTGKITFNPNKENIFQLIESTISILLNQAQNKNISILNLIEENLNLYIDKNLIKTIIRNLVSNAIKFSPEGSFIKIWTKITQQEIWICVEDNGIGIPAEQIPLLFTSKTSTTSGTSNEKGSGLGLLLCRDFAHLHKGRMAVESKKGEGSTFCLILPKELAV